MKLSKPKKCGDRSIDGVKMCLFDKADTDRKQRLVTAIANTAAIDMDDEVVIPEGAPAPGKAYFDITKTIYYNHQYDSFNNIGTMRWRRMKNGSHMVQFYVTDKTPAGRYAFALLEEGIIKGVSIGFEALDRSEPTDEEIAIYGPASVVTRSWEWVELSVTSMPCNKEAVVRMVEGGEPTLDDDDAKKLDGLVRKGVVPRDYARSIGLSDRRVFTIGSPREVLTIGGPNKMLSI